MDQPNRSSEQAWQDLNTVFLMLVQDSEYLVLETPMDGRFLFSPSLALTDCREQSPAQRDEVRLLSPVPYFRLGCLGKDYVPLFSLNWNNEAPGQAQDSFNKNSSTKRIWICLLFINPHLIVYWLLFSSHRKLNSGKDQFLVNYSPLQT